jgi:hypothetical protein
MVHLARRDLFIYLWEPPPHAHPMPGQQRQLLEEQLLLYPARQHPGNRLLPDRIFQKGSEQLQPGRSSTELPKWGHFGWLNSGLFKKQKANTGLITFLVIHCLFVCCRVLLRDYWLGL